MKENIVTKPASREKYMTLGKLVKSPNNIEPAT